MFGSTSSLLQVVCKARTSHVYLYKLELQFQLSITKIGPVDQKL